MTEVYTTVNRAGVRFYAWRSVTLTNSPRFNAALIGVASCATTLYAAVVDCVERYRSDARGTWRGPDPVEVSLEDFSNLDPGSSPDDLLAALNTLGTEA